MLCFSANPIEMFFEEFKTKGHARVVITGNQALICPREEDAYYKPIITIKNVKEADLLLYQYLLLVNSLDTNYTNKEGYHDVAYYLNTLRFNMASSDANNFENYLKKRIAFLKDNKFSSYDKSKLLLEIENISFYAQRISEEPGLETPNIIDFSMKINENIYQLPIVRYAFDENGVCYLYAIQVGRNRICDYSNQEYKDIVNQVNGGLKQYRNVSPGFVFSFILFLRMLKKEKISTIFIPDFLCQRYKKYFRATTVVQSDAILNRTLDKFLVLIQRMEYQLSGFDIEAFPNDVDSYTHIKLTGENLNSNNKTISKILEL